MAHDIEKRQESSGIAALRLLSQHYRLEFYGDKIEEKLDNAPPDIDLDGVLLEFAEECGFGVREYKNVAIELVAEAIDRGMPPMIKGKIGIIRGDEKCEGTGYVLISGYQRHGIKSYFSLGIIDPVMKKKHQVSPEQFYNFWNNVSGGEKIEDEDVEEFRGNYTMILVFPPDREPPF